MDLDGALGVGDGDIDSVRLGGGDLPGSVDACIIDGDGCVPDQQARRLQLDERVGQLQRNRLMRTDRHAPAEPMTAVLEGQVKRGLIRDADREGVEEACGRDQRNRLPNPPPFRLTMSPSSRGRGSHDRASSSPAP